MTININNKIKQFFGRNWSCNKFTKKNTKIREDFGYEKNTHSKKKRRKKKATEKYISPFAVCPFCGLPLEVIKGKEWWWRKYAKKCESCGARVVSDCPACKRDTWLNSQGVYKHQNGGCGFTGKRKVIIGGSENER